MVHSMYTYTVDFTFYHFPILERMVFYALRPILELLLRRKRNSCFPSWFLVGPHIWNLGLIVRCALEHACSFISTLWSLVSLRHLVFCCCFLACFLALSNYYFWIVVFDSLVAIWIAGNLYIYTVLPFLLFMLILWTCGYCSTSDRYANRDVKRIK